MTGASGTANPESNGESLEAAGWQGTDGQVLGFFRSRSIFIWELRGGLSAECQTFQTTPPLPPLLRKTRLCKWGGPVTSAAGSGGDPATLKSCGPLLDFRDAGRANHDASRKQTTLCVGRCSAAHYAVRLLGQQCLRQYT